VAAAAEEEEEEEEEVVVVVEPSLYDRHYRRMLLAMSP